MRNLASSLIIHGRIKTIESRAKVLRSLMDKLVVVSKRGTLAARRQVYRDIADEKIANKLFDQIVPGFNNRTSGFTRITKIGSRVGDGADLVIIEFVEAEKLKKETNEKQVENKAEIKEKRRESKESKPARKKAKPTTK